MLSRSQRLLFLAAAIAPAAIPLVLILRYGVNMPYMDEWDFVRDLHLANEQGRLLAHLFTQFNESRPAVSRLLFLALAKLSNADFRAPMLASWLTACGIAWNIWRLAKPGNQALPLAGMAFANLLIFSPIQHETWLWGNQVIVLLPMLCLTTGLRVLSSARLSAMVSLFVALAMGVIAMYSFSGGLFVLPALAAALWLVWPHWKTYRLTAIALWTLTFGTVAALYFRDYIKPPGHPGMGLALVSPLTTVKYFVMFLGSIHSNGEPFVAVLAGVTLLGVLALSLRESRNGSMKIVIGFVILSAAVTAIGRVNLGVETALAYRYMSVSLYLTVGIVALAMANPQRPTLATLLLGALAATSVHGCIRGIVNSQNDYRAKQYARTCVSLLLHTTDGCSDYAPYPGWAPLRAHAPVMERLGLFEPGLFAGAIPDEGPTEGTIEISPPILRGTVRNRAPIHAILLAYKQLAYKQEESVKWLGTAMPFPSPNGTVTWESRLPVPAAATQILAFRYNADTGEATFVAAAQAK